MIAQGKRKTQLCSMKAAKKKMSIHVPTISSNSTGSTLQPYIYDVAE
jgi:hypothetical protein